MTYKQLMKKYPIVWDEVYSGMIDDLCDCMPQADVTLYKSGYKHCRIERLAHNAAFIACAAINRHESDSKNKRH